MEACKLGARTLARGKGLEDFFYADVPGDAVVWRHLAGAIEPVAGAEFGAQHDETRRGLDVEGAKQPRKRYTPEQIIGILREAEVRLSHGEKIGEISRSLGRVTIAGDASTVG